MHILEKYIDALNTGDAQKMATLFSEECIFDDGGARPFGIEDLYVEGKENVEKAFTSVFEHYKVKANLLALKESTMDYDVILGELLIPCIGTVEERNGLITHYTVRPR